MTREPVASVVFLNRFYWPGRPATGQMLTDLAEDLVALGWDVTVVTSRTSASRSAARGSESPEVCNGVKIVRVRAPGANHPRLLLRGIGHLRYIVAAARALLRLPRPDLIVAMTDPPLMVLAGLVAARMRRTRLVCWVQDFFPNQAARLGMVRDGSMLHRALTALSGVIHRRCDALVSSGERMTEVLLSAGAPADRVSWIPNWADTGGVRPIPPESNPFRAEHGLERSFVVLCSAGVGTAHTFAAAIDAAWLLRHEPDIVFLFVGGGQKLSHLEAEAWRLGLENVQFIDDVPQEGFGYALAAADVALVTENPTAATLRVPSKTYRILASGRPLVFVGSEESEVARIVASNECGVVLPQDNAEALAAAIVRLRDDRAETVTLGARARKAAVTRFDRRIATYRWHNLLERVLDIVGSRIHPDTGSAADHSSPDRHDSQDTDQPVLSGTTPRR